MNIYIHLTDITDEMRSHLADIIDGKETKRLAKRAEIVEMVEGVTASIFADRIELEDEESPEPELNGKKIKVAKKPKSHSGYADLCRADPEDAKILKGKSTSYIIGWNKVKRKKR